MVRPDLNPTTDPPSPTALNPAVTPLDPTVLLTDMGRQIAELRAAQDWTQEEFAEGAGVTVQYLQRIEGGRENLTVRSLVRLANLLGVPITQLFAPPLSREVRPGRPRGRKGKTSRSRT